MSTLALIAGLLLAGVPALAAEETSFGNDLKATIALQGLPCDQVVETQRRGDSDYTVSCKDGNRYHVFVNAQGRVVVDKLTR
jgi:hypothetical protein